MRLIFVWYAIVITFLVVVNIPSISIPEKYFSYGLIFVMVATPVTIVFFMIATISTFRDKEWRLFFINFTIAAMIVYLHRLAYV